MRAAADRRDGAAAAAPPPSAPARARALAALAAASALVTALAALAGDDCADAGTIGGHLYGGESDPWSHVTYDVHGGPASYATGATMVPVGMSAEDLIGRAFVVHDFDGARIACGYVSPPAEAC